MLCTLTIFTLSFQKEHVRVDGPLLDILLDPLHERTRSLIRLYNKKNDNNTGEAVRRHTHHFGVSPIDDDAHAVWSGGHLTGRARGGGGA